MFRAAKRTRVSFHAIVAVRDTMDEANACIDLISISVVDAQSGRVVTVQLPSSARYAIN